MEFYGFKASILTELKPRSILLLKIHKMHIARYGSIPLVYGYLCLLVSLQQITIILYSTV